MPRFSKFEYMDQRFYTRFRRGEGVIAMRDLYPQDQDASIILRKGEMYHISECFYDEEYQCEFVKIVELGPQKLFTTDYFDPCEPSFGMTIAEKVKSLIEFENDF